MKTRSGIILLLIAVLLTMAIAGCANGSGDHSQKQNTPGSSAGKQSTAADSAKGPSSETAVLSPVIEKIDAFFKKDTALKESDEIVIYIRNVAYDVRAKAFKEEFKVYLDDKEQAFHDVKPIGADYQEITVDISGITSGSVSVTYGELKSNQKDFKLK